MERAGQVGADDGLPLLGRGLQEGADQREAGVVDEPVDASEALDDALDEVLGLGADGDVRGERVGFGAGTGLADPRQRPLRRLGRRAVVDAPRSRPRRQP